MDNVFNRELALKGADMKEVFEKIIERLEEEREWSSTYGKLLDVKFIEGRLSGLRTGMRIVKEVAEECKSLTVEQKSLTEKFNDGWIPCSERLPDKYCHCLVTRRNDYEDGGFDSDVREDVYIELEGVWDWQSKFEGLIDNIIAWMPKPEPYKPKGEK